MAGRGERSPRKGPFPAFLGWRLARQKVRTHKRLVTSGSWQFRFRGSTTHLMGFLLCRWRSAPRRENGLAPACSTDGRSGNLGTATSGQKLQSIPAHKPGPSPSYRSEPRWTLVDYRGARLAIPCWCKGQPGRDAFLPRVFQYGIRRHGSRNSSITFPSTAGTDAEISADGKFLAVTKGGRPDSVIWTWSRKKPVSALCLSRRPIRPMWRSARMESSLCKGRKMVFECGKLSNNPCGPSINLQYSATKFQRYVLVGSPCAVGHRCRDRSGGRRLPPTSQPLTFPTSTIVQL